MHAFSTNQVADILHFNDKKTYCLKHSRISLFHMILDHNQKYDQFAFSFRSSSFVQWLDEEGISLLDMRISFLQKNQAY